MKRDSGVRRTRRTGHTLRTCLVCRRRFMKKELLRFVADQANNLQYDRQYIRPGRGVYCCRSRQCLDRFFRLERGLARALRCPELTVDDKAASNIMDIID